MALVGEKETVTLRVGGMTCGHCVQTVEGALKATPGVKKAVVDLDQGYATVTFDPGRVRPEAIAAAVASAGYEARLHAGAG